MVHHSLLQDHKLEQVAAKLSMLLTETTGAIVGSIGDPRQRIHWLAQEGGGRTRTQHAASETAAYMQCSNDYTNEFRQPMSEHGLAREGKRASAELKLELKLEPK